MSAVTSWLAFKQLVLTFFESPGPVQSGKGVDEELAVLAMVISEELLPALVLEQGRVLVQGGEGAESNGEELAVAGVLSSPPEVSRVLVPGGEAAGGCNGREAG